MKQTLLERKEIKLVGVSVRTSYHHEIDKMKGKIFPCVQKYFHESLYEKIPNRACPRTTFCAYTDYENDYKGAYTYFIGEEITSFDSPLLKEFSTLTIPKQKYAVFTTEPAPMPNVIINAWTNIWKMSPQDLGGKRTYKTDFEIYDERAADHQNIVLDIYVGIKASE